MSDLYHNCIVHPLCGLLWALADKASAFADRWHDRTAPDHKGRHVPTERQP